jgi:hypothetical protein
MQQLSTGGTSGARCSPLNHLRQLRLLPNLSSNSESVMAEDRRSIESTASNLAIAVVAKGKYGKDTAAYRKPIVSGSDHVYLHLSGGIAFKNPQKRRRT